MSGEITRYVVTFSFKEEVRELAAGLAEAALHRKPDIDITTFEAWQASINP